MKSLYSLILVMGLAVGAFSARPGLAQTGEPSLLAEGNNAFAFDLYQAVRVDAEDLIFSPYSISQALAMVYAGARGQTETQMAEALNFTLPQADLHPAFSDLIRALQPEAGADGEDQAFRLNIANALWGQSGYAFLPAFLTLLSQNYGAGLQPLDFRADVEAARQVINDWASRQTEERIQDLIAEGVLDADTRLVLTNAIYFKAAWLNQFDPGATQDGPFTLLDGSTVTVPMMRQDEHCAYLAGEGVQAVELPYEGDRAAMLILVPDAGAFDAFEGALDSAQFAAIRDGLEFTSLSLTMPRFEYRADFDLADTLAGMGMPDAFNPNAADFSGMTEMRDLFIGAVIHQAYVKVDEEGTEAAAATAVEMAVTSAMLPEVSLTINRPFIYVIYDRPTGTILFLGRVLNPVS